MVNYFNKNIVFLMCILIVGLWLSPYINRVYTEGFALLPGEYPIANERVLLDNYQQTGAKKTSTNGYDKMWKDYPIFSLGSYEQITNNLKHFYNPDNGTCTPADFCKALYRDKNTKNIKNTIVPLDPAEEGIGARVGYYRSEPNRLYFSIPTNENILY